MIAPLTINNATIKQPTTLREYQINIQNDNTALDGSSQRNRVISSNNPTGQKYAVDMTWEDLGVSDFQTIHNLITSGSGIVYSNPASKYGVLTFSGLPTPSEPDSYIAGDSLLTTYQVSIRQI